MVKLKLKVSRSPRIADGPRYPSAARLRRANQGFGAGDLTGRGFGVLRFCATCASASQGSAASDLTGRGMSELCDT